jgi:hypothetical protein
MDERRKFNLKKTVCTDAFIAIVTLILKQTAIFVYMVWPQSMAHQSAHFFHSS